MHEAERATASRRQFLAAGGTLAGGLLVGSAAPAAGAERQELVAGEDGRVRPHGAGAARQDAVVRYDVATFTEGSPQLTSLRRGVAAMKARPASDPTSWAYQADIHRIFCDSPPPGYSPVHYSWRFLAWHRAYLWYFEKILQQAAGDPTLTLPYWNWTTELQLPAQYWGAGNPLYDPRRVMTQTDRLNPDDTAIARLLALPTFGQFGGDASTAGALETGPHNYVHRTVGGDMGRFSTAAIDPIFWAHHANVDRVWWMWNQEGNANPADPSWLNIQYPFYDIATGGNVNVTFAQAAAFPVSYAQAVEVIAVTAPAGDAPRTASVAIPAGTAARLAGVRPAGATLRVAGVHVPSEAVTVRVHANPGGVSGTGQDSFAGSFTLIPTDGEHSAHGEVNVHMALGGGFHRALDAAHRVLAEAPVQFTLVPEGPGAAQLRYRALELHVGH
jgi:hypothetical protein